MTQYTYISSIDYINNLTFDYVETYSFQRGSEFEENHKTSRPEYEKLKVRKDKHNDLTVLEEKQFLELHDLFGFTQYLINGKGQFHPSSTKTHTFKSTDPQIDKLKNILRTEIIDIPAWMCAPMYRDAIVFYDKLNRIVSTLNVCLSCEYMETKMFSHINGDNKTYDLLRQYFIDLGHKIEDR
ncbi:hypothetical protein [Fluviicola taffensis]|uniref:Uncharacterized protein n=1 Tax=Fluviicola taffensis (strain DSM 16823 / NCIMB 13979 / RW262) TaxID=755732 RepID=F2IG84_FLUTR|nr:hypothetical protein [Fluviicola taffensis]AEA45750.1 hypothetical protein Fluta_3783 [Fluviicola taffensis DSM 16823]